MFFNFFSHGWGVDKFFAEIYYVFQAYRDRRVGFKLTVIVFDFYYFTVFNFKFLLKKFR
ncbi:hypothetical protein D3C86_2065700 [compost metagenome]